MGSSGWSIGLQPLQDKTPASWSAVRDVTMRLLWDAWQAALPKPVMKQAWAWVSMGEDSLLGLGESVQDQSEQIREITFGFDPSVGWPSELADHWLSLALAEQRERFEHDLAELGYALEADSSYPQLGKHPRRFILAGKRIGHTASEGVYWALPDHGYQSLASLPPALQKRTLALADGGACECPYCVKLGIAAAVRKKVQVRKKRSTKKASTAKKTTRANTGSANTGATEMPVFGIAQTASLSRA